MNDGEDLGGDGFVSVIGVALVLRSDPLLMESVDTDGLGEAILARDIELESDDIIVFALILGEFWILLTVNVNEDEVVLPIGGDRVGAGARDLYALIPIPEDDEGAEALVDGVMRVGIILLFLLVRGSVLVEVFLVIGDAVVVLVVGGSV